MALKPAFISVISEPSGADVSIDRSAVKDLKTPTGWVQVSAGFPHAVAVSKNGFEEQTLQPVELKGGEKRALRTIELVSIDEIEKHRKQREMARQEHERSEEQQRTEEQHKIERNQSERSQAAFGDKRWALYVPSHGAFGSGVRWYGAELEFKPKQNLGIRAGFNWAWSGPDDNPITYTNLTLSIPIYFRQWVFESSNGNMIPMSWVAAPQIWKSRFGIQYGGVLEWRAEWKYGGFLMQVGVNHWSQEQPRLQQNTIYWTPFSLFFKW